MTDISYQIDFQSYCKSVYDEMSQYDVVTARERRGYNLFQIFYPDAPIVTNNALRMMHGRFAKQYKETGTLPSLLICDDIMVHGRAISKILNQLEQSIIRLLEDSGVLVQSRDYYRFKQTFSQSVTISIYAVNAGTMLLDERFLSRLKPYRRLYAGQLRDVSLQLSERLRLSRVANTSFAMSVSSKLLACAMNDCDCVSNWKKICWQDSAEKMLLFVRTDGENNLSMLSTIRLFPERYGNAAPLVTSFTMTGTLPLGAIDKLAQKSADILSQRGYRALPSLLLRQDASPVNANGQLLLSLLSMIDLHDFCTSLAAAVDDPNTKQSLQDFLCIFGLVSDLNKLAHNFDSSPEFFGELLRLSVSPSEMQALASQLRSGVRSCAKSLMEVSPSELHADASPLCLAQSEMDYINKQTARYFYLVGCQAEMSAYQMKQHAENFEARSYQRYEESSGNYGRDGIVSLKKFLSVAEKKVGGNRKHIMGYIAAWIMQMDHAVVGAIVGSVYRSDLLIGVTTLNKAGELATLYGPKQFSLLVPAFAIIEEKTIGDAQQRLEAILLFMKEKGIPTLKGAEPFPELKSYLDMFSGNAAKAREDITRIYECGQTFRGWNFENLTEQKNENLKKLQHILCAHASI
ncbi:MAG: hypothetical protein IJ418_15965 [Clostridia bacterium]|nr:hypothetical protein [Clostridia bacterium]